MMKNKETKNKCYIYTVDHITVPHVGFTAATQREALIRMGAVQARRAMPGESTWTLCEKNDGACAHVVFYTEGSERLDLVASAPSGNPFIIEKWEGGERSENNLGSSRHTFVKRIGAPAFEYLGVYEIVALFGHKPEQITLWHRASL